MLQIRDPAQDPSEQADVSDMRWALICFAALVSLAPAAPVPAAADLHGTTRAGERFEPHAVVWLDAPSAPARLQTAKVVLDQRDLDFWPHVLAVQVGTVVEFPNDDRVFHNVFSFHDGKKFDLGLYPVGTMRRVTFDHSGISRIFCNIHPNMGAHVIAVDTPYFAVSDETGRFTIAAVPPGTYPYHVWRPGRLQLSGTMVMTPDASLDLRWQ